MLVTFGPLSTFTNDIETQRPVPFKRMVAAVGEGDHKSHRPPISDAQYDSKGTTMNAFDTMAQQDQQAPQTQQSNQPAQTSPQTPAPAVATLPQGVALAGNAFDQMALQSAQQSAQQSQPAEPGTPEEQAFLKAHPDHVYLKADPKFPNRPEGIYPTGKGNEWRKDPSYSQEPVDPEMLKHTVEYGVGSAAATGLATVPAAVAATAAAFPNVLPHTIEGVKAIGAWANKNPFTAWMIFNALKEYIPGAKKAIGFIKGAPTGE